MYIIYNAWLYRFQLNYVTLEHFEPTSTVPGDTQFSETAFQGSVDSLVYLKIDSYTYFRPSPRILIGKCY